MGAKKSFTMELTRAQCFKKNPFCQGFKRFQKNQGDEVVAQSWISAEVWFETGYMFPRKLGCMAVCVFPHHYLNIAS